MSRFRRLHAFQACLFSHSSIFPMCNTTYSQSREQNVKIVCKFWRGASIYMSDRTSIRKAESRSKACFDYAETHRYICAKCKYSHFQQNSAQNVERKLIIRIQKQIQTWNGIPGEVGRELMQACQPVPKTMFPNARRNIQFPHNTFWLWTRCSEHHICIMLSCCVQVFRPTKVGQSQLSCPEIGLPIIEQ